MVKTRFAAALGGGLFIVVMGGAASAAEPVASAPKTLDLSLPREAGQWTGIASRARPEATPAAQGATAALKGQGPRERIQPYGTGYEARMSGQGGGAGSMAAAAGGGVGGGSPGAASPAPRGGGRGR